MTKKTLLFSKEQEKKTRNVTSSGSINVFNTLHDMVQDGDEFELIMDCLLLK